MPRYIPDRKTPCSVEHVRQVMELAWPIVFPGTRPSLETIYVLLAQWNIETGGKSMHLYNIGNIKGEINSPSHNWTLFSCNEFVTPLVANMVLQGARARTDGPVGPNVVITEPRVMNSEGKIEIWLYPPHPGSCFRAYESLQEGVEDYLRTLHDRFPLAWPEVLSGDPIAFGYALGRNHYFTAPIDAYARALKSRFDNYRKHFGLYALEQLGYPRTTQGVKTFQEKNGLRVDGIIGLITSRKLQECLDVLEESND